MISNIFILHIFSYNYPLCRGRGKCQWFFGYRGVCDDFSDWSTYGLSTNYLSRSSRRFWLLPKIPAGLILKTIFIQPRPVNVKKLKIRHKCTNLNPFFGLRIQVYFFTILPIQLTHFCGPEDFFIIKFD